MQINNRKIDQYEFTSPTSILVYVQESICLYCVLNDLYYDRVLIFVGKMSVVDKDILQVIIRDSILVKPLDVHAGIFGCSLEPPDKTTAHLNWASQFFY